MLLPQALAPEVAAKDVSQGITSGHYLKCQRQMESKETTKLALRPVSCVTLGTALNLSEVVTSHL